jgi:hypothetical protein
MGERRQQTMTQHNERKKERKMSESTIRSREIGKCLFSFFFFSPPRKKRKKKWWARMNEGERKPCIDHDSMLGVDAGGRGSMSLVLLSLSLSYVTERPLLLASSNEMKLKKKKEKTGEVGWHENTSVHVM